jgi:hypothetical protein
MTRDQDLRIELVAARAECRRIARERDQARQALAAAWDVIRMIEGDGASPQAIERADRLRRRVEGP